jgi:hypothetical protein
MRSERPLKGWRVECEVLSGQAEAGEKRQRMDGEARRDGVCNRATELYVPGFRYG